MLYYLSVAVLVFILQAVHSQAEEDYCKADYCQPEQRNVGCKPPPAAGGSACVGKSAASVELVTHQRAIILHQHNTLRSQLATGGLAPFDQALRMPTLVWDEELARQAAHNARSCIFAHDACRNTKLFRYVGQNIALVSYTGQSIPIDRLIRERIEGWWSEFNHTTQAQLDRFPKDHHGSPTVGHFTQMVSDRTWKIGCAVQTWLEQHGKHVFYFVCNYSFANFEDQPVYRRGPKAFGCQTGESTEYPGLCSKQERIFSTPTPVTN